MTRAERTKAKDHATFARSVACAKAARAAKTCGAGGAIVLAASLAVSASIFSSGCVAAENAPPARGYVVNGPPPPPIAEARPQAPPPTPGGPAPVWVAGYWHWVGVQYAWIPGHWEEPPAGSRWAAPQYSMRDGAYFYAPGDWQRAPNAGPVAPAAPQPAAVAPPQNANAFH